MHFGLLLLATGSCTAPEVPQGSWRGGDLHVHSSLGSNDTDGLGSAEALGPAMATAALDWLVITDHSNSAGSMDCPDVEDCPNQGPEITEADWPEGVVLGSEISPIASLETTFTPTGHVGCIPRDGQSFVGLDHFVDRPAGDVTGGDAVQQCQDAGGWAIINHPYAAAGWIAYDWTHQGFDALEVYNGGSRFDPWDAEGLATWETLLADGEDIVPVGGSDCHRWGTVDPGDMLNPALGWPRTRVHVRDDEDPIAALQAGRVVIEEPGTTLSLVVTGQEKAEVAGGTVEGPATLRAEATADYPDMVLQLVEIGSGVIAQQNLVEETLLEHEVTSGTFYARVWPTDEEWDAPQGGVALTATVDVL